MLRIIRKTFPKAQHITFKRFSLKLNDPDLVQKELRISHPFKNVSENVLLKVYDNLSPIVNTHACFDELRVPPSHVSRRPTDTYYLTETTVLRTHTSAHQCEILRHGCKAFLCAGDVYRRDEIDATHYPVFHQIEGVRVFDPADLGTIPADEVYKMVETDLKQLLDGLARHLFGNDVETRWRDDYFPFTEPSFELDVRYKGDWMELLGCGVIHTDVMHNAGLMHSSTTAAAATATGDSAVRREAEQPVAWAFGLGLERLAMVLFNIPDIRLFWSEDIRFKEQFSAAKLAKGPITFLPYSKYPDCYKDISFWLPHEQNSTFHSNDVYEVAGRIGMSSEDSLVVYNPTTLGYFSAMLEIIRTVAGDIVERVHLFDVFTHPKSRRMSHAYRISYRHMDRSLTNEEVDELQARVRLALKDQLGVELR